jgi:tetratricopeptide (TPR) repeat protein
MRGLLRVLTNASSLTLLILVAGCAARGPSPQTLAELGRADALVRQGCYFCLKDALAAYERLAASPRPPAEALPGAFNAAVLLTVRAKELGLPSDQRLTHARDLATRLPTPAAGVVAPAALVDAAAVVVGETSGFDPEERQQRVPRRPVTQQPVALPQRVALEPALATSLVAEYLALAIDCDSLLSRETVQVGDLMAKHASTPLMRFRVALCGRRDAIAALRAADPRWAEAFFFEGGAEMTVSREKAADPEKALPLYVAAHDAFPESIAMTLAVANVNDSLANFEPALAAFDAVLATSPAHRDAMLGRVKSLSYLTRHAEAIDTATRMIELGTWLIGDAYYWRAWNQYNLKAFEPAWDDVEQAIKLQSNSAVYMLAGLIAYERKDLPTAIQRFDRSYELDATNCDAEWMSALVHVDQKSWGDSSPKFTRAMSCFVSTAATAREDLARLEVSKQTPAQKAKRAATLRNRIETAEERSAQSAFNAAQCYALVGNKPMALTHVDVAMAHPKMREKAAALRAAIEKMP